MAKSSTATTPGDTDGDGLSDADEASRYGTDPNKFDTDGDSQSDGAEIRAGTDPKSAQSIFRITESPVKLSSGGWRISWSSVSGKSYKLQRLGNDEFANTLPGWIDLTTVVATTSLTMADDSAPSASGKRFYRVVLVENAVIDPASPKISPIQATPPSLEVEGVVTLTATVLDNAGVARVTFHDGLNLIGSATRVEGSAWRFLWPVTFDQNGVRALTARATNLSGAAIASPQLAFTVAIPKRQAGQTIGQVTLKADILQTNGTLVVPTGNVRVGLATFSTDSSLSLNTGQGMISGQGRVSVAGIGLVANGSFSLDTATGLLSPASANALPPAIPLNSTTVLKPTELKVNVQTGALQGKGAISLQVPGNSVRLLSLLQQQEVKVGPVTFSGDFNSNPETQTLNVTGTASYAGVTGTGGAMVQLSDSTFTLTGQLSIASGSAGAAFNLNAATFQLRVGVDQKAEFSLTGKPALPALAQLALNISGTMDTAGNISLNGEAAGALGPVSFNPATVTLKRDGAEGALVDLKYRGALQAQGLPALVLAGQIQLYGNISPPELEGDLNLGAGIRIRPKVNSPTRLRVSVKYILDGSGQRPGTTGSQPISTDDHVRQQIQLGNDILARSGNKYQFELTEIVNVSGASDWFNVDTRTKAIRLELQKAAFLNPALYSLRADALNVYINGNTNSGNAATDFPDQIILIGQGGKPTTIAHEAGHYFGLWHTQGRACGGCDDPNESSRCTVPGDDEVSDTLPELDCWDQNEIAQWSFNRRTYNSLTANEREQVDFVFFNLMSYHGGRDRLTSGQLDRITRSVNGPRFHVADRPSILEFLSETAAQLEFKVEGEFLLSLGNASQGIAVSGSLTIDKTGTGFQVSAFSAASASAGLTLELPGSITLQNARVTVAKSTTGAYEVTVGGQVTFGGGPTFAATGKVSNNQLTLSATVPPLVLGEFRLEGANGGNMAATVGSDGLNIAAGARLLYKGVPLTAPQLPQIRIAANGNFTVNATASMTAGLKLGGYGLNNAAFTFQVTGGIASIQNFDGSLSIPGLSTAASVTLAGSLNSNGTFSLSSTTTGVLSMTGLSFSGMAAGATVTLTQNGLTVEGTVNGGVITQFNVTPPRAVLTITASGGVSLASAISVTLSPVAFGEFRLESLSGGGFTATLSASGLTIPTGARLLYKGVALTTPALPQITIAANGNFSVSVTAGMTAGLRLSDFPINNVSFTFARTLGVTAATDLRGSLSIPGLATAASVSMNGSLNSDGTFSLLGSTAANLSLAGLPVTAIASAAVVRLDQDGLKITGSLSGGSLAQTGVNSVAGTLAITSAGAMTLSGTVSLPPIVLGEFRLEASGGGNFSATLANNGVTVPSGARLLYKGAALTTFSLPSFTVGANGDFTLGVNGFMTAGLKLNGFTINNGRFTFARTAGVTAVTSFNGSLSVPGLSTAVTVEVTGSLNSNGTYSLLGSTAANLSTGLLVTSMASGAAVKLNQDALTITGSMSGGTLVQVGITSASGALTIPATGAVTATVSVPPLVFGEFRLEASGGGNFNATVASGGVTIPSGARLLYKGVALTTSSLPSFTLSGNGSFSISIATSMTAGMRLNGFTINSATFTFARTATVASATGFTGSLSIPGVTTAASATVTGTLNSNGNFNLTGTTTSTLSVGGLPIGNVQSGATVNFTQDSLTIGGTLSGGLITTFGLAAGTGAVTITSNNITVSGNVVVSPLVFGEFRIEPSAAAGGNFATLGSNGLTLPAGARLLYKGIALTTASLPQFTIAASGDFNASVTAAMTSGLSLSGFAIGNAAFTFARTAGVTAATGFAGTVSVPGLSATTALAVSGSLNSNGTFSLTRSGTFTLTGFTVASGNLTLSNTGLTGSGNLSIANLGTTLALSGRILADGSFSLTQNLSSQTIYGFAVQNATYTLAALAGSAPSLAVALNVNVVSISGVRFNGTLFADGLMDLNATLNSSTVAGYGLTSISLNFAHSRNSTAAATLSVSGDFNLLGVNRRLSGTISTGGSVTMSRSGSLTLGGFTLANGNLNLSSSGFTISGNLSITGLSPALSLSGIILGDGGFVMTQTLGSQSFFGFSAQNVRYSLTASSGGNVTLSIDTMNLNVAGINTANFSGTIRTDGFLDLRATPSGSLTLAGFGFSSVVLDLDRAAGGSSSTTLSVAGDLNVPNVAAKRLSGTISAGGTVNMSYGGSLTLGGFTAANGALTLSTSTGLRASGSFNITAASKTFNSGISFSGSIPANGQFNLTGSGSLQFASYSTDTFNLKLSKDGLFLGEDSTPQLNFGGLLVPFTTFSLNSTGVTSFSGSKSVDSGWVRFFDSPKPPVGSNPPEGDIYARTAGTVSLSSSANGTISASLSYTWAPWLVYRDLNGLHGTPDDINSVSAPPRFSSSGGIGSDGKFTVDKSFEGVSNFNFDFWNN